VVVDLPDILEVVDLSSDDEPKDNPDEDLENIVSLKRAQIRENRV